MRELVLVTCFFPKTPSSRETVAPSSQTLCPSCNPDGGLTAASADASNNSMIEGVESGPGRELAEHLLAPECFRDAQETAKSTRTDHWREQKSLSNSD